MRALLRLAAWYPDQGFHISARRIEDLLNRLRDQRVNYGTVTWLHVRNAFLETKGIKHHSFYRPPHRWDVQLFDIGFVRHGRFTRLCNVADQVDFSLEYQKPLLFATFPDIPPQIETISDGMTRYPCNLVCEVTYRCFAFQICVRQPVL